MEFKDEQLKQKVAGLAEAPGIYIFKDNQGAILYIGKASSLKKRVQSYFYRRLDTKTQIMIEKVKSLDFILTSTEAQAQLLEAALIKHHQPPYNIDLKDDKSFPWIRITNEQYPVVSVYRRKKNEPDSGAWYFGPYTNVRLLRQALRLIRQIFGFRSCRKLPKEPCLYYRIKLCPGPCIKKIAPRQYQAIIEKIKLFLDSQYDKLQQEISWAMHKAAEKKRFEEAARLRDQLRALGAFMYSPKVDAANDELIALKEELGLSKIPVRIEAFDISNIVGQEACGSMVSFYRGVEDKKNYRRFRIRTVTGIDDYAMIREVVLRRYSRLQRERGKFPDLIIIDGGRSHLLAAKGELKKLSLDIPLVAFAKERENVYFSGGDRCIRFSEGSLALNLLRKIRDEAHRFALSYHHLLRRKRVLDKNNQDG